MYKRMSNRSGLWANTDFLHLWGAETVSQFGAQISTFAVPLIAAITLNATPLEMGILSAAGPAPRLVIGFIAGAWADRLPRRPIMIATDVGRMFSGAIVPIAALSGWFSFNVLLIAALLSGLQSVFFDAAWNAVLPNTVRREELTDATSKLMGTASVAQIVGPALGGIIVGWIGGPSAMWIPVVTFAISAWLLLQMKQPEVPPAKSASAANMWREVKEGLHELWRDDIMRALMNTSIVLNFGGLVFLAVYVLFMTNDLGLSSAGVGLVFASGGVGALVGALIAPWVARKIGIGQSILWGAIGFGLVNLPVPLAFYFQEIALPVIVVCEALSWLTLALFNINRFALRQALTPDHLRGRIGSSSMTLVSGASMAGSLVGGIIGDVWGVHEALYVGIFFMAVAGLWVWRSPVPGVREIPEDVV
ncbi:MAG: MFS transporter [Thermomicrobiales bacterium]|nr:MFS transporter [Thermomicrobiales bacterium]MCO5225480.1 MFS transporter [Thermomicrobiales bacterium]